MFSKLYEMFTKKGKKAKDKIEKKVEAATSDDAMDNSAINHPIKIANTLRGITWVATTVFAFATWHISIPFAIATFVSSSIINEYGIESNNKKRQLILKRKKEAEDKKKEYDALRVQEQLKPKEEYKKGDALVKQYQKKHHEQQSNISLMKKCQLVSSVATAVSAFATLAVPVVGPFLAAGTVALAAVNGIVKHKTNQAVEEMEATTLEYDNAMNEHKAFIQQCKDKKLKKEKEAEEAKKAQQNPEKQQQHQQQKQGTTQNGEQINPAPDELLDKAILDMMKQNTDYTYEQTIKKLEKL